MSTVRETTVDRNDLAYWFPRLEASGVQVPRTEIVHTDLPLIGLCEGETPEGFDAFLDALRSAGDRLGWPCFLRTGHGSGKHSWRRTCFVREPAGLAAHVAALVEWSETVDFLGLPYRTWVVREFLALRHRFAAFEGMPVAREFRCFFRGGESVVACIHPYWPAGAIAQPSVDAWEVLLAEQSRLDEWTEGLLRLIVARVAPHFEGAWSLDVAQREDLSWVAIDMATACRSFHWPGCVWRGELSGTG